MSAALLSVQVSPSAWLSLSVPLLGELLEEETLPRAPRFPLLLGWE